MVEFGDERGGVHHGDDGGSGGCGFSGEEGTVGDEAIDGAADLGVAELGLGSEELAFGRLERTLRGLEGGFVAEAFDRVEVLPGDVVGGLRLGKRDFGGVKVASGDGSLFEELGAGGDDGPGEVERALCLDEIEVGLGVVLGDRGTGGGLVSGLRGGIGSLVVEGGCAEVTVFECSEQLAGFNAGSPLDEELLDGCCDLGGDGGLGQREERGVGGDLLADAGLLRMDGLHVDEWDGGLLFFFLAGGGEDGQAQDKYS